MASAKKRLPKLIKEYYKLPYESFRCICEADNACCFEFGGEDYIILNRHGSWFIALFNDYRLSKNGTPNAQFGPCDSMDDLLDMPCLGGRSFHDRYDELAIFDDHYEKEGSV